MTNYIPEIDEICDGCGEDKRCVVIYDDSDRMITALCQDCMNYMFETDRIRTEEEL